MNQIGIVIPAFEPDERLLHLLNDLTSNHLGPIYIVDDGSAESFQPIFQKASEFLKKTGGTVLHHPVNRGKGRALKTAFEYILNTNKNITAVVTADSDGQHTPECIKKVIHAVLSHDNYLVLGVRTFDTDGIPWKSRLGNRLTEKLFRYLSGVHISDTQTGLRGIPRKYMQELLDLKGERFEFEMRMLLDAADRYPIMEVPIATVYDSAEHHQTHFNPIMDSLKIYRILGEKFMKYVFSSLSSCVLDLVLFWLICISCRNFFPLLYITVATITARFFSSIYNYFINYKIVFRSREKIRRSVIKYYILAILQMTCSAVFVTLFKNLLPVCPEVVIKIFIDTVLFFISYHIQQNLIFKKTQS